MRQIPKKRKAKADPPVTATDIKLLLCMGIFLASVLLKYAEFDGVERIRTQTAAILHGGADLQEVVETVGRVVGEDGLAEVFAQSELLQSVFQTTPDIAKPASVVEKRARDAVKMAPPAPEPALMAESGYAEDLADREQTLFPKVSDETAYIMAFPHENPVQASLTSDYGGRVHPISGKESFHYGLDLAAPKGTAIGALAGGTVREVGFGSYGKYLIVDHDDGFSTLYAHCDEVLAKEGDLVTAGQEIARVGATGNATGNHLHLEVWRDGKALDPGHYTTYT